MKRRINKIINEVINNYVSNIINEDRNVIGDGTVEIDNFDNVRNLLQFNNPGDTIYFVEILQRKKDNHDMYGGSVKYVKQFYFKNIDEFNAAENSIKTLCKELNARAYIYLNARSKATIDKYTEINKQRFAKHRKMADYFDGNAMAYAAGRSLDAPDRPLCFVDIDSDDFNDIKMAMKIIQDAGITPLFAYRSLNNGLHIILPDKEAAKKLDFTPINGNLNGLSQFYKNNAKVSLEIDKPSLLYACLSPNGYDAQRKRFAKGLAKRSK